MRTIRAEAEPLVLHFRRAQSVLKHLRAIGAAEPDIRRVMLLMGFGDVTPDEFLAARTEPEIARLLTKVGSDVN